ncbi:hypothetical protein QWY79_15160 [Halomonas sabkhae]|uniref:hypothetical protein n=1 Tax=Halomonas sabkhae TaxID=626223 RepID=UPI0025B3FEC1|nr:hypothetical protein [Halomonas sabkhae]MDN3526609.1 hypothetical protein [Halomonas sabkhae]
MARLFIHAGNHKTGTTSIQKYLFENRGLFLEQGVSCFLQGIKQKVVRGNHSWWFDHNSLKDGSAYFRRGFAEALGRHATTAENVVVSSECFSWVFDKQALTAFAGQLFQYYDDVQVVFYIRRQDRHAVSHYQQAAKSFAEREFFTGNNGALPDLTDNVINYLDYHKKLLFWESVFGQGNVTFKVFDDHLASVGVVSDFLRVLGLQSSEFPEEGARANESWGWEKTKVFRILNQLGVRHQSELGKTLKNSLDDSGKLLPSLEEASTFYDFFCDSNKKLAERLSCNPGASLFEEDFTFYPEHRTDYFDEASADKAIEDLAQGFLDYLKKSSN